MSERASKGKPRRRGGAAAGPPNGASDRAGPLVLIVDDFPDNRDMYVQFLSFHGYRVAEAVDGLDALTKAAALRPDLIVMDLSLPRLDGWEATRRLKQDPLTSQIPVVALTGHALAGHEARARNAGCDSFVTSRALPPIWRPRFPRPGGKRGGAGVNDGAKTQRGKKAASQGRPPRRGGAPVPYHGQASRPAPANARRALGSARAPPACTRPQRRHGERGNTLLSIRGRSHEFGPIVIWPSPGVQQ